MKLFGFTILLITLIFSGIVISQPAKADVKATLALADQRSVFRIGEPIRLKLTFTSTSDGYFVDQHKEKPGSPHETLLISPTSGVYDWSGESLNGRGHFDDVAYIGKLSDGPIVIDLTLNDFVRFDAAGRYSVRFRTNRVFKGSNSTSASNKIEITTNEISFGVTEMEKLDELRETMRLSAAIDASTGNWAEQTLLAERLSYLAGDPSTGEKLSRFLTPLKNVPGNFDGEIRWGLFIARNRALVVRKLEEAFRDNGREVDASLLHILATLRALHEKPNPGRYSEESYKTILERYLRELIASLPKRSGIPRGAAAITILQNLPRENPPPDVLSKIRAVLLEDFDTYNLYSREYLLSAYWDKLKDPSLLPSIERMLDETSSPQTYNQHVQRTALERLIDLDQAKARPYVISDLQNPRSYTNIEVLRGLNDELLPEADEALLRRISELGSLANGHRDNVQLRLKSLAAARYATAKIYDGLMQVYRANRERWFADSKAALLGYFVRHNEAEAIPMIRAELEKLNNGAGLGFLGDLVRVNYPKGVDLLLRDLLDGDDLGKAGAAAYFMGKHGGESSKMLIRNRLERWRTASRNMKSDLDAPNSIGNAMFEINLLDSLRSAKAWKLSDTEFQELTRGCLSNRCREHFRIK